THASWRTKERGDIELAKLKLANLDLEWQNKKILITNEILASYNEFTNTEKQAAQFETIVEHYYRLLQAEKKLFEIGESSVFMVNNRELSYINAKIKLNDLQLKTRIAGVELLYNTGQLFRLP
ncbi:MAG TPA: transporter, partial [Bacteroidetes bacterium]|nr:transporter [Bacteroidota bacterium]